MNIRKMMGRYGFFKCPTLKVVSPRLGTSIVPLRKGDGEILFSFLKEQLHALHFEGSEKELRGFVSELQQKKGVVVQKMGMTDGRMHLHLILPDFHEIRRVIRVQS